MNHWTGKVDDDQPSGRLFQLWSTMDTQGADVPHRMHPIPVTATSAGEGSPAIVPVAFMAWFHAALHNKCQLALKKTFLHSK